LQRRSEKKARQPIGEFSIPVPQQGPIHENAPTPRDLDDRQSFAARANFGPLLPF
jgi:hypothetical protein